MRRTSPSDPTSDLGERLEEPGRGPGAREAAHREALEEAPACAGRPRTRVHVVLERFVGEAATP